MVKGIIRKLILEGNMLDKGKLIVCCFCAFLLLSASALATIDPALLRQRLNLFGELVGLRTIFEIGDDLLIERGERFLDLEAGGVPGYFEEQQPRGDWPDQMNDDQDGFVFVIYEEEEEEEEGDDGEEEQEGGELEQGVTDENERRRLQNLMLRVRPDSAFPLVLEEMNELLDLREKYRIT